MVSKKISFWKMLSLAVLVTFLVIGTPPLPTIEAQSNTVITISVPGILEDLLTPEILGQFEAQNPGVTVNLEFGPNTFFGFGGSGDLEARLDKTEEYVSTADVLYVDPSTLYVEATQAGYFLDLAPLANNDPSLNVGDFVPTVWNSFQWENGIWGLPVSTDVILLTYDPVAFDAVGLAYPTDRWTIDDFANAARLLTEYDADGNVAVPGMTANSGGDNTDLLLRALYGAGLYDSSVIPNSPSLSNPSLEVILDTWHELKQEGVVSTDFSSGFNNDIDIPIRIEGVFGYSEGINDDSVRNAVLLPGNTAGLGVQGFAISSGTLYPEEAYALAAFMTTLPDIANNPFSVAPARQSLAGLQDTNGQDTGSSSGGPGGGGGRFGGNVSPEIQAVVDQSLFVALPVSELRYSSYLSTALNEMTTTGVDARPALQSAEAQAVADLQTAIDRRDTVSIMIATPPPDAALSGVEITLNCAINTGFSGGRGSGQELPNQTEWDQVIADFVANNPQVGQVNFERTDSNSLTELAEQYDCFILSSNEVPGNDLSGILNLDPLIDTDTTFDRNDVVGNTLVQLQVDNRTWALPLAIQPQLMSYNSEMFQSAGVPAPVNGWTIDEFTDALRMLKPYPEDPTPFVPNDPSGSYLAMLIGAFGGMPTDYRTDPATLNFTDPATVDAIQQVLDLAIEGYIDYSSVNEFGGSGGILGGDEDIAITTEVLRGLLRGAGGGGNFGATDDDSMASTTYPQGNQFGVIAYEITTGYISATAQNPEAAYRFLSTAASNPQLFTGMPARRSLVNSPGVLAAQGADMVAIYQQLDLLMQDPNTVVFPVFSGRAGNVLSIAQEYWLRSAYDNYVFNGADLAAELAEAETFTLAYQECAAAIPPPEGDITQQQSDLYQQIFGCITLVDPTASLGGGN